MANVGGNYFEGVTWPIALGDRYVHIGSDCVTGAPLVDVYRWDRPSGRLLAELIAGEPVAGGSPITVTPEGGTGGVRLGVDSQSTAIVGYLSGGVDPRYVVARPDRLLVLEGEKTVVEVKASSFYGSEVGIAVGDDGSVGLGAAAPLDLPRRRTIEGATIRFSDLVREGLRPIAGVDFRGCTLLGPALLFPVGSRFAHTQFGPGSVNGVLQLPARRAPVVGAIVLDDVTIEMCEVNDVVLLVPDRAAVLKSLGLDPG